MSEQPVEISCKILPLGNFISIIIVVNISLTIMFLEIFLGFPVLVNMVSIFGIMFLMLYFMSATAIFSVSEKGLIRKLHTTSFLFRNTVLKQFSWSDVKAYKSGTDINRSYKKYQYLEIKFRNGDEWKMTDTNGEREAEFLLFLNCFLENVEHYNQQKQITEPVEAPKQAQGFLHEEKPLIERRKTIYETFWGKLFTVLLGVFIVLVFIYARSYMGGTSVFKFYFILIPGFAYMFYRTFMKKS